MNGVIQHAEMLLLGHQRRKLFLATVPDAPDLERVVKQTRSTPANTRALCDLFGLQGYKSPEETMSGPARAHLYGRLHDG